jgi:hypothetical protein
VEKRLSSVGNGLALFIDKPIRDLLGIRRETLLRLTTDGRRLVIEPIDEPSDLPPPSASQLDALPVFAALAERFQMSREQFRSLHHDGASMGAYHGWLQCGYAAEASPAELATIRRLEACLHSLRSGASWEMAIGVALAASPRPVAPI